MKKDNWLTEGQITEVLLLLFPMLKGTSQESEVRVISVCLDNANNCLIEGQISGVLLLLFPFVTGYNKSGG